ncbi:hypothetical protein [uncultured Polaribacter sp.]|uniref:hypothetical protein n=1 Tax=uncultured Polaribacter sp. TaxID=174711 RepID=UPI002613B57A|nr:hypothetical protein [uncultured Polaribacter sp.]
MSFINKIKQPQFFANFLKIAIPFFIIVTIVSLLMNSFSDIFAGNFTEVANLNFNNGKWISFFGIKIAISIFYGVYVTLKKTK